MYNVTLCSSVNYNTLQEAVVFALVFFVSTCLQHTSALMEHAVRTDLRSALIHPTMRYAAHKLMHTIIEHVVRYSYVHYTCTL
jgi:hypothetical protein